MKLELKHLAGYFPFDLMCEVTDQGKKKIAKLCGIYSDNSYAFFDTVESEHGFEGIKPILYPIESLTKEIIEDIFKTLGYSGFKVNHYSDDIYQIVGSDERIITVASKSFMILNYEYVLELQKRKYDINNLIPKGLAIDVTTLELNPYK